MAGLHFPITADNRGFMQALHEITAGVSDATRQIEANGGSIDKVISMIKTGVASIGIGLGFKELVGQITNTRDEFQKLEIAFKTFLGSEEEANKLMQQMVHTAAITPFDLAGVADGAKNLLAFGVAAEDVNKTIISLGDIAAGLSQPLGDIIYLYGTTIAKPKMDTQDLMQMMGRGIPIAKELAKQFGVAENKVRDLISAGKVSGEAVKKAFESMTAEGSMFGGLMEAQSKSIGGQIANIEDSIDEMFNAIGKSSEGIINTTLEATSKIVESWQSVLLILGDVAAAYGAQKAILALDAGFTKAATNYGYDAEIEQLKALIPVKEEEAITALQQAVASGNLTEAKAAEIAALREEADEYLKVLAAKEAEAKQNELTAQANLTTAYQKKSIADEMVEIAQEKWQAAYDAADALAEEAAAEELETARAIQSEAADALSTAAKEAKAASSAHVAAQQQTESASTAINTAQTTGNTAATGILTIAKEKLAVAIGKVNMMLKANQFALVTGAVIALGYAIYKAATYEDDFAKIQKSSQNTSEELSKSWDKEKNKLDELKARLESTKKGSEEWKSIKDTIISQYGQYDKNLATEIEKTGTLATSYDNLAASIRKSMLARAMNKYDEENDFDYTDLQSKVSKGLEGTFAKSWKNVNGKSVVTGYTSLSEELKQKIRKDISDYMAGLDVELTEQEKKYLRQIDPNFTKTSNALTRIDEQRKKAIAKKEGGVQIAKDFGYTDSEAESLWLTRGATTGKVEQSEIQDKAYWEGKKKEAVSRLEALDSIAAAGAEGVKIKKEIEGYEEKLKPYSTKKEKTSGPTSAQLLAKEENAAGKLADVIRRQAEDRLRLEQDYEYERWQTRIDLMEDGEAKVLAQQKLDFNKEKTALERRKKEEVEAELQRQMALFDTEENVKAAANKKYDKKTFDRGDVDLNEAISRLLEVEKEIKSLNDRKASVEVEVKSDTSDIDLMEERLAELERRRNDITVSLDVTQESKDEIVRLEHEINSIEDRKVELSMKSTADMAALAEAEKRLIALRAERFSVSFDMENAGQETLEELKDIEEQFDSLIDRRATMMVAVNTDTEAVEELDSMLDELEGRRRAIAISAGIPENAVSELKVLDNEIDSLNGRVAEVSVEWKADTAEISEAEGMLKSLRDRRYSLLLETESNAPETIRELKEVEDEIEYLSSSKASLSVSVYPETSAIDEINEKLSNLENRRAELSLSFGDVDERELRRIAERFSSLESDLTANQKKAESDRLDAAKESMNAYLKEFGSYQQKRKAIEEEYQKKISEAPNRGERKIAMAGKDKALADLDYEEWQENGGMALVFGDISRLSKETVTQLISDMEKYRSKIIATFDPDKIQKFEDALANLRNADIDLDLTFNGDNEILDAMRERLALQQQIADASANEAALLEQKKQIEQELSGLNARIFAGGISTAAVDPNGEKADDATVVNEDMIAQADALRVKLDAVSRSLEKSTRNSQQLQSQLKALGKVKFADIQKFSNNLLRAGKNAADLASIFSDDLADSIQSGADRLGVMFDAFTELSSNIEALAKAGKDAVKETVDASKTIVDGASSGMKASATATSASLSTMEKASAILAIIGAAIQLATMVASLFNKDKKHEKNIEKIQDQIDALQKSYDKLGKALDNAFSTDAGNLIEQQDTLLRQQQALIRQQMMEEEAKKKTDSDKIKQYQEQLEEINDTLEDNRKKAKEAIIGEDLKSAINEFASLYADAWNDGSDAAQKSMAALKNIISSALSEMLKKDIQPAATKFYDALAEAMKDGVLTDVELGNLDAIKREIDALAAKSQEQWEMIQSRYKDLDELREELTDVSFDSVRDNFKSLLSDMESTTADFTNSFSDMLRNALIEGLMSEKYDLMLKEWYDEFAEKMDDRKLTDEERDALRQQYDAIVQQGLEDRDFINSIVGGGSYSQEATTGGWETMGQDQADELNGRFTALTELEAINNSLVSEGNMIAIQILDTLRSLSSLSMVNDGENPTLREIRDMMFLSTGHLEDISKYTKQLITIREGIDKLNDLINQRL